MAYAILVVSTLLLDFTINLPTGSLPLSLHDDGVSPFGISIVIGFGLAAALGGSVPIGGLVDRFGRLPVIRLAGGISLVALFLLAIVHGELPTGLVMALRSLAFVAYTTAEFAYASALVAPERSASAVGTLGMIGNIAFATSPALSVWLWQHGIGREQYLWALIVGALGVAILFVLPKTHELPKQRRRRKIFMRSAWLPAIVFLVSTTLQSGVNAALAVITFHQRGVINGALIFTAIAATTFALRYPAGRFVDRFGPRLVAIPAALAQGVGCLIAARATTPIDVIIAGVCLGVAWAAVVPVGLGLFFEKSSPRTRGAAMGAYNFAFSLGAACGAIVAAIVSATHGGYGLAITICAFVPLVALPYVFSSKKPQSPLRRTSVHSARIVRATAETSSA